MQLETGDLINGMFSEFQKYCIDKLKNGDSKFFNSEKIVKEKIEALFALARSNIIVQIKTDIQKEFIKANPDDNKKYCDQLLNKYYSGITSDMQSYKIAPESFDDLYKKTTTFSKKHIALIYAHKNLKALAEKYIENIQQQQLNNNSRPK